jgi:hypothetical protein
MRRLVSSAPLAAFLGFAAVSVLAEPAQAPAAASAPSPSIVQTVDFPALASMSNLDGPWRFHAGDNPVFSLPAFDDSAWPAIRAAEPFSSIGIPGVKADYIWARTRLRVPAGAGKLSLVIDSRGGQQYEIFADGVSLGASPGMSTHRRTYNPPFAVSLPPAAETVLAIRFYIGGETDHYFPLTAATIGPAAVIGARLDLDRLRDFNNSTLADCLAIAVYLLVALVGAILYFARRDYDEYLWLAAFSIAYALYVWIAAANLSGWLPYNDATVYAEDLVGWGAMILNLEFVMHFARTRRRRPVRILQAIMLFPSILAIYAGSVYFPVLFIGFICWLMAEIACLVAAYRRGQAGVILLLIALIPYSCLQFAWAGALAFPATVPWGEVYRFGLVGVNGETLAGVVFVLGIVAVVLYRFIRISQDEGRAAAELEAARNIQQILIPDRTESVSGFSVESIYQPAQQVGGDFFQVLPTPEGGLLLIVGDVAGKGLPAAMLVAALVGAAQTIVRFTHLPAEILEELNERLVGRAGNAFATCLAVHIASDGDTTMANAGHLPPYLDGREIDLPGALPLGVTSGIRYEALAFHLNAGSRLTFYSDGIIEATSPAGELFGFDRGRELSTRSVGEIAETARAFGQQDDITVVAISRAAPLATLPA